MPPKTTHQRAETPVARRVGEPAEDVQREQRFGVCLTGSVAIQLINFAGQTGGGAAISVPWFAPNVLPLTNEKERSFFCGPIPVAARFFAVLCARENCAKFFLALTDTRGALRILFVRGDLPRDGASHSHGS